MNSSLPTPTQGPETNRSDIPQRQDTWIGRHSRAVQRLEVVTGIVIIAIVSLHVLLYFDAMRGSSMWTDELGTIKHFIDHGPIRVMTDYSIPRNHIFFSLINSLVPGGGLIDPLRARMFSFLFTALLGVGIGVHFLRRDQPLEAGGMFFLWGMSGSLLELSLQARGYGLLCLLAFASCWLARLYSASGRLSYFSWLAVCMVLGAYTVPPYVMFGGPLMLVLLLQKRDRRAGAVCVLATLLLALLYAPVMSQLAHAASSYADTYGRFYASFSAVAETLQSYLWPVPAWLAFALLGAVVLASVFSFGRDKASGIALRALMLATLTFLGFCLVLQTPPVRTTAFVALPIAFCTVLWARQAVSRMPLLRLFLCVAMLIFCPALAWRAISDFRFTPYEDWERAARFVQIMYPQGTLVDITYHADGLTYYIDQDHYRIFDDVNALPLEGFRRGLVPVVAAPWKQVKTPFRPSDYSKAGVQAIASGQIRDIAVNFAVPQNHFAGGLPSVLVDGDLQTTWKGSLLEVSFPPGPRYHSLNLLFKKGGFVSATVRAGVGSLAPAESAVCRIGTVVTISLGDQAVASANLELEPGSELAEAWANPTR